MLSLLVMGMAGTTGLEPATSDVTGRRSNQLNYVPVLAELLTDYHSDFSICTLLKEKVRGGCWSGIRRPANPRGASMCHNARDEDVVYVSLYSFPIVLRSRHRLLTHGAGGSGSGASSGTPTASARSYPRSEPEPGSAAWPRSRADARPLPWTRSAPAATAVARHATAAHLLLLREGDAR